MTWRFLSKVAMAATFLVACGAFFVAEAQGAWLSQGRRGDCDGGMTRAQTKAMSACELARARQLADLSCAELSRIAEFDRQGANLHALANYHRYSLRASQPRR